MTALLVLVLLGMNSGDTSVVEEMPADFWRSPKRCGQNCLYAYIKLNGKTASLASIARATKADERGMSLADLKEAANELGVPSRVIRGDSLTLAGIGLPAIAHLNTRQGHYVVLLRIGEESVSMIDMVSGRVEKVPTARFLERWSGYLVIRDEGSLIRLVGWKAILLGSVSVGMASLSLGLILVGRRNRRANI